MTTITKELLISDGWEFVQDDPSISMEKKLANHNPICEDETTDIYLAIHNDYNVNMFAVILGECGMLNFKAESMEELKDFESKILFFDPNF